VNPFSGIAICASIVLGVWHFNLALQAIFVFRTGEPIVSWIVVLTGPACTLPAALFALFTKQAAGYWLCGSGVFSSLLFAIGERGATENLFPFLSMISVPMILVGVVFLYLSKKRS
jgi:hypothetical protein